MDRLRHVLQEKALGVIGTLLTALILFIIAYITKTGSDCAEANRSIVILRNEVERKLDRAEFDYYKNSIEQSIADIKEMLKEIRQDVKHFNKSNK